MNKSKLKLAVDRFYEQYPEGFNSGEMAAIGKKHRMPKMIAQTQEFFPEDAFSDIQSIIEHMVKIVTGSSMVSVFEKPKFRDYSKTMGMEEKSHMAAALKEMLHGNQEAGFDALVEMLADVKLAKWTLVSVVPAYFKPDYEVFMKPTTVKNVISYFEIPDLVYKPRPSYDFYRNYRNVINEMKLLVPDDLKPSNAAFSGFLMMSYPEKPR